MREPIPGLTTSNVLRPGLAGLIKNLTAEIAPIRINGVAPGRFATDRVRQLDATRAQADGVSVDEVQRQTEARIPLGRYGRHRRDRPRRGIPVVTRGVIRQRRHRARRRGHGARPSIATQHHRGTSVQGIYNIVPTPFDETGAIDEASLARLIEFVIGTGVDGLTILGFLGEAGKLTESERALVIEISVATAGGRVPVVVGATAPATDPGIAFARDAVARGAAGLLVAPPRLARPNEAAVHRHYEAMADAVDAPIVVQDFPSGSGVFMTPDFIGRLAADIPSCRYLKLEDDPTAQKVSAILAANPDVQVFGGLGGNFMLEELQRGAVGMMTGFGFPEIPGLDLPRLPCRRFGPGA